MSTPTYLQSEDNLRVVSYGWKCVNKKGRVEITLPLLFGN